MRATPILACIVLTGCTASYHQQSLTGASTHTSAVLSPSANIYVALPADGAYEDKVYQGSGAMTAQAIAAAFAKHGAQVTIADHVETRTQALDSARAIGAQAAAVSTLTQWEPRSTEWSGRPSRMAMNLEVDSTSGGTVIGNATLEARSRIVSFTRTSPESLLRGTIEGYVATLYNDPVQ